MPDIENRIRAAAAQIHVVLNAGNKLTASNAADIGIADTVRPRIGSEHAKPARGTSLDLQLHRMVVGVANRLGHVDRIEALKWPAGCYAGTPGPGVTIWMGRLPSKVAVSFVPFDPT